MELWSFSCASTTSHNVRSMSGVAGVIKKDVNGVKGPEAHRTRLLCKRVLRGDSGLARNVNGAAARARETGV